ncbi:MAG: phosphoribosyl-AMP cyclohydrolase [Armatimonadetes bacterium]|nr:phosphoribosyl-AMP cyclohydrolase [Armatimonadota bacterium]
MNNFPIQSIRFDKDGLVPAVVQHHQSKDVLMLGFMNREALLKTVGEGNVCFWSRSRQKLWLKGETSGNFLRVRNIRVNCENNSLLIFADPVGPTCHTGHESCYYRQVEAGEWVEVMPVILPPDEIYTKTS